MIATHTTRVSTRTAEGRKLERKQRALAKAQSKEMRMADKGKPTKRRLVQQAEASLLQAQTQTEGRDSSAPVAKKRSDKLARQLQSLIQKDAQWETLCAKSDAITKAKYREARVADFGRKSGHKMSAPRVTRRDGLIAAAY